MKTYVEYFWDFKNNMVGPTPINAIAPPYIGNSHYTSSIPNRYVTNGKFELAVDEALIVSYEPGTERYFGIMLADLHWFVSFDFRTRQTTLAAPGSIRASSDGRYHFVVSARDPGVQNWLDTAGRSTGVVFLRWQGVTGQPPASPTSMVVPIDQVRRGLPDDEPLVSAQE